MSKQIGKPLTEGLNDLRRLSGLNEQSVDAMSSIVAHYGQAEAGIIVYDEENGDEGDCEQPVQVLMSNYKVNPSSPIQAQAQTTVQHLVADLDNLAKRMGFIDNAFDDTAQFWIEDWLGSYPGNLLLVATTQEHEDLGNCTLIFCIKI